MHRLIAALLAAAVAAAVTAALALAGGDGERRSSGSAPFSVGLWGDVPYSDVQVATGVPNLIADMNRARLAFSVHNGDIKSGSSRCDDEVYTRARAYFDSLRAPAIYTPGDNEWTDCDRASAGAYSSRERLDHLRATLFADRGSLCRGRLRLRRQAAPYVENARWRRGGVVFATLHVVGSDNNLGDVAPDRAEWAARDAATNRWLRETFAVARRTGARAVLLVMQANPGFDDADPTRAPARDPRTLGPEDGFAGFLRALREQTIAFRRPVALVHGDSHYARVDKPLLDARGRRVENLTRVETPGDSAQHGNNDVHWLKLRVDPGSREVFSYEPQVVPGNRVAVPAP